MKKEKKKDKFPNINREVSISKHGAFYYKPICFPAVVDENGIILPSDKAVEQETRWVEEHQL